MYVGINSKEVVLLGKLKELLTDDKMLKLYETLTESDFKGNTNDTYVIELLYALTIVDLVNGSEEVLDFKGRDLLLFAKEVVRIFETDDNEVSYFSARNWTEGLIEFMRENNYSYKDIHKKNTYELREEVRKYLKTDY